MAAPSIEVRIETARRAMDSIEAETCLASDTVGKHQLLMRLDAVTRDLEMIGRDIGYTPDEVRGA